MSASFPKEKIIMSLANLGIDENIRGEKLSIEKFGMLSEELLKL